MEEIIEKIVQGHHFRVNFYNRSCKVGKKILVENGEWFVEKPKLENVLKTIQDKFNDYYNSKPSERSCQNMYCYFKAKDIDKFTSTMELVKGGNREVARFELEFYMLAVICEYKWEELFNPKYYFYKGENGLVILKNWFSEV